MKTVTISVSREYQVKIDRELLCKAGEEIRGVCPQSAAAAVITDDNVAGYYLQTVRDSLQQAGFRVSSFVFKHGEASKNAETYIKILNFLAEESITRSDIMVALGGGVVGDIAGFAAATYLRGVRFVQIPTSLLAMVDSSVGGKTAIDLEAGKNLAGAFCQPSLVLCDLDTLNTLQPDFFTDGCAEIIKYGILNDRMLFDHLLDKGQNFDREYVISRSVEMKRDYVTQDEYDTGMRMMLNFGHTVGHAIERCSHYRIPHGSAVAMGMAIVTRACEKRGQCSRETSEEILKGLAALKLPVKTKYSGEELIGPMLSDKKRNGATVSLIVPFAVGDCRVFPTPVEELLEFVEAGL